MLVIWSYLSWWLAAVPAVVLAVLWAKGRHFDRLWWIVAAVFGLSWLADTVAFALAPAHRWIPSLLYPMAQALLLCAVLLNAANFWRFAGLLTAFLGIALLAGSTHGPDDVLRTLAWVGGGLFTWDSPMPLALRQTLVVTFGLGAVAWVWHMTALTAWPTWYVFQATQAAGVALFCVGAWRVRGR